MLGLLTGLLPCGWLYAFVIAAAATGTAAAGALTMAVFWAGTLPVMLTLGLGLERLTGPLRRHVPTLTALALIVVGAITVAARLHLPDYASVLDTAAAANPEEHVHRLGETPACCDDHPPS